MVSHELGKFLCKGTRESSCSVPQWPRLGSCKTWGARCRGSSTKVGVRSSGCRDTASPKPLRDETGLGWVGSPSCPPKRGQTSLSSHTHHIRELWSPSCLPAILSLLQAGALSPASNPRYLVTRVSHSTCSCLGFPPLQVALSHLWGALKPSSLVSGFVNCFEQGWTDRDSLWQLPCYLAQHWGGRR